MRKSIHVLRGEFRWPLGPIFRYASTTLPGNVPAHWQDKVMHGSVTIGEQVLMGADLAPNSYEAPKGVSRSPWLINCEGADE